MDTVVVCRFIVTPQSSKIIQADTQLIVSESTATNNSERTRLNETTSALDFHFSSKTYSLYLVQVVSSSVIDIMQETSCNHSHNLQICVISLQLPSLLEANKTCAYPTYCLCFDVTSPYQRNH